MYHDEIPERCKLNFTGIVDDALRIAGELFPKQTLKKYIRKEVEIDTDGRVSSRRFEKKEKSLKDLNCLQENRLKVNSEREQDSPVEMEASNISRFKELPFLKAKRHRAHSVVSGVRVKFTCRNCGGGDRGRVAIYRPFGEVSLSLNRTVTCVVLKTNDRRTSCPSHDEFRGPRSDYVRQPPGQPIGVNVHYTHHPIREQPLSSQPSQKTQKLSTQMKHHSHAFRIPSFDQSPSCHSAEWKTPLLSCPAS
ncbi:uncharacterized protein TNCV_4357181 [Trichonephila clavipes]|nr:uncharacterized protein TNCV_4357181 [Trichonephila clavipes]